MTSYEIVIADSKLLQRYTWKYIIVDEGHRLKNFNCKLLRELRQIPVDNKLLLTGVIDPCQNACIPFSQSSRSLVDMLVFVHDMRSCQGVAAHSRKCKGVLPCVRL